MLERAIIDHASPTLARLKLGSLVNPEIGEGFFGEFARLGGELRGKGVKLMRIIQNLGVSSPYARLHNVKFF